MKRLIIVLTIFILTLLTEKFFTTKFSAQYFEICNEYNCSGLIVALIGICLGGIYWIKFGISYSCLISQDNQPKNKLLLLKNFPGKKYLDKILLYLWSFIAPTFLGKYLKSIYQPPVNSEQVLGGFFFGKTLITTAIAFYYVDTTGLISILVFSAVFDSLTGIFQQTLMNFFHKSIFENKIYHFIQNLVKRYLVDIFRAEIITFLLLGLNTFLFSEQFHIFQNRFVSASYYFNALIIDKLVEMNAISRNFRSKFVIVASSIGGMLCLLDFAKTDFPSWIPITSSQIPSWVPGPLMLLGYFNLSIFIISLLIYYWTVYLKHIFIRKLAF